jgi:hypothetical protein
MPSVGLIVKYCGVGVSICSMVKMRGVLRLELQNGLLEGNEGSRARCFDLNWRKDYSKITYNLVYWAEDFVDLAN